MRETWWIDYSTTDSICVTWAGYTVVDHSNQIATRASVGVCWKQLFSDNAAILEKSDLTIKAK